MFNTLANREDDYQIIPGYKFISLTFQLAQHLNTHIIELYELFPNLLCLLGWKAMQAERKWHILLSIIIMLITSSQCMDSKEAKLKERRTLLDLILQVIGDNQRDKLASRRITSGLYSVPQDLKFSSREKSLYFPKQDRSKPIGKQAILFFMACSQIPCRIVLDLLSCSQEPRGKTLRYCCF